MQDPLAISGPAVLRSEDEGPDVTRLLDKCLTAVEREVNNLYSAALGGKLDDKQARELRDYTKLLYDLEQRQIEAAKEAARLANLK